MDDGLAQGEQQGNGDGGTEKQIPRCARDDRLGRRGRGRGHGNNSNSNSNSNSKGACLKAAATNGNCEGKKRRQDALPASGYTDATK